MPLGFESGSYAPGIELFWERVPANEAEPLEPIVIELDDREYLVEVFEVEDMTASADSDISP